MRTNIRNRNRIIMENFQNYCRKYVKNHIYGYVGRPYYGSDLGNCLTEGPNMDGSLTMSMHDAMEYLIEWWWECADYFNYEKDNFGDHIHNPFENPEAYMVCMVINGVDDLLAQCSVIDEHWSDKFELTEELASQICEEIESNDYKVRWAE